MDVSCYSDAGRGSADAGYVIVVPGHVLSHERPFSGELQGTAGAWNVLGAYPPQLHQLNRALRVSRPPESCAERLPLLAPGPDEEDAA